MTDVLVVGGGPAGAMAALTLAHAGVRVTVLDRATFPRDTLCGDSVNPGAMALLERHGLSAAVRARALPVRGMLLTGPRGTAVDASYPPGLTGCSIRRLDLDALLLEAASRAGARLEQGVRVSAPVVSGHPGAGRVAGLRTATRAGSTERPARLVIAADGRRSTLAFALSLARHPRRPRRWAMGAYFEGVAGPSDIGEMHVRHGHYIGVAPVPGGLTNVCLVVPEARARQIGPAAGQALDAVVRGDALLGHRFANARRATPVRTMGPLAVDVAPRDIGGLLLAGDAAGFVDPMTGDGLRLALHGGELAAEAALELLAGREGVHRRLAHRRQTELGAKLLVNRSLRWLVAAPAAVSAAAAVSRVWPGLIAAAVRYAGDVGLALSDSDRRHAL
jgi:flavin-dependent dehydrogenase